MPLFENVGVVTYILQDASLFFCCFGWKKLANQHACSNDSLVAESRPNAVFKFFSLYSLYTVMDNNAKGINVIIPSNNLNVLFYAGLFLSNSFGYICRNWYDYDKK